MFTLSEQFLKVYPKAHAGLLVIKNVENPAVNPQLEKCKRELEQELRDRFSKLDPHSVDKAAPLPAYSAYYKKFDKTYHVAGQLKSIIYKDKPIPSVAALVEAMFIAELKNGMLTAGHDLDKLELPMTLDIATGAEQFITMRGDTQALKAGDMFISDTQGVLSAVIYGPDQRTQINSETRNAVFTVYAPEGVAVDDLENHLADIRDLVELFSPDALVDTFEIFGS